MVGGPFLNSLSGGGGLSAFHRPPAVTAAEPAPSQERGSQEVTVEPADERVTQIAVVTDAQRRQKLLEIFSDVYSTLRYQPYAGAKKGPVATGQTGAGNSWDQASLLKKRIGEHPWLSNLRATYVFRVVEAPAANVAAWLGVEGEAAAERVLHRAGLLARRIGDKWKVVPQDEPYAPEVNGEIKLWHTWLYVQKPGTSDDYWELDPSWKYRRLRAAREEVALHQAFDDSAYLTGEVLDLSVGDRQSPLEWYETVLQDYIAGTPGLRGEATLADLSLDGPIIAKRFDAPPPQTEYRVVGDSPRWYVPDPSDVRNEITDKPIGDWTHRLIMHVDVSGDGKAPLERTFSLPDDGLKVLGVGHNRDANSINGTRESYYTYKPIVYFDGVPDDFSDYVDEDASVAVKLVAVAPGQPSTTTLADTDPADVRSFSRRAKDRFGVIVDAQQNSSASVLERQEQLNELVFGRAAGGSRDTDFYVTSLLSAAAAKYAADYDDQRSLAAGLTGTLAVPRGIGLGLVTAYTEPWSIFGEASGGPSDVSERLQNPILFDQADVTQAERRNLVSIDLADRQDEVVDVLSDDEDSGTRVAKARLLVGYTSSYLEHAVLQEVLNVRSVSTVKAFQWATANDVTLEPVETVAEAQELAFAGLKDDRAQQARDLVAADVAAGYAVTVTNGKVAFGGRRGWEGVAWVRERGDGGHDFLLLDSRTGEVSHGGPGFETQPNGEKGDDAENLSPFGSGTVNLYSGDLSYVESDVELPNPTLPLGFTRYYDSGRHFDDRGLGAGWSHNFGDYLQLQHTDGEPWGNYDEDITTAAPRVALVEGSGSRLNFFREGSGNVYRLPSGVYGSFEFLPATGDFRLASRDGSYRRFEPLPPEARQRRKQDDRDDIQFRLAEVGDRLGNRLVLKYDDAPGFPLPDTTDGTAGIELREVRYYEWDPNLSEEERYKGRRIFLDWEQGHIKYVTDFAERTWLYEYHEDQLERKRARTYLSRVTEPSTGYAVRDNSEVAPVGARGQTRYTYSDGSGNRLGTVERVFVNAVAPDVPDDSGGAPYKQDLNPSDEKIAGRPSRGSYAFDYYPNGRTFGITSPTGHGLQGRPRELYTYDLFSGRFGDEASPRTYTARATLLGRNGGESTTVYNDDGLSEVIIEDDRTRVEQGWEEYAPPPAGVDGDPLLADNRVIWRQDALGLGEGIYYDDETGDVRRHITGAWNFIERFGDPDHPEEPNRRPIGQIVDTTYTSFGLPATVTVQPFGGRPRVTTNAYDTRGLLERTVDPVGNVTAFEYLANGQLGSKVTARGWVGGGTVPDEEFREYYEYDFHGSGQLGAAYQVVDGQAVVSTTRFFDESGLGLVLEEWDANAEPDPASKAHKTFYTYDVLGRRLSETRDAESVEEIGPDDRPAVAADHQHVTRYTYDGDWLVRVDSPGNADHPRNGSYEGKWVLHEYDDRGFRFRSTDGITGASTWAIFDASGNKTLSVDALGQRTQTLFDARNRPYQHLYPDGSFKQVLLDGAGRTVEEHAPVGGAFGYQLDPTAATLTRYEVAGDRDSGAHWVHHVTDAAGNVTESTQNPFGEVAARKFRIPADGALVTYSTETFDHDDLGRVVRSTATDRPATETEYDPHGNVVRVVQDASGDRRASYALFDALDRKTLEAASLRAVAATFVDGRTLQLVAGGIGLAVGDRVWITGSDIGPIDDLFVSEVIDRDTVRVRTRLTDNTISPPVGSPSFTAEMAVGITTNVYDDKGRLTSTADARGFTTDFEYDALDRLVAKTLPAPDAEPWLRRQGTGALRPVFRYDYYADGTVARELSPAAEGVVGYEGGGANLTSYRYHYGRNFTSGTGQNYVETTDAAGNKSFRYLNPVGQVLAERDRQGRTTTYSYDGAGRQTLVKRPDPGDGSHGAPQRVTEYDDAGRARVSFTSDGNRLDRAESATEYDALGRPVSQSRFGLDGGNREVAAWHLERLSDSRVRVWLTVPGGHGVATAGERIVLWNGRWSETRTPLIGGQAREAEAVTSRPDSGAYYGQTYTVAERPDDDTLAIDLNGSRDDWAAALIGTSAAAGPDGWRLDVFLPEAGQVRPVLRPADVLTRTDTAYRGGDARLSRDERGYVTRREFDAAGRVEHSFAGRAPDAYPADDELLQRTVYNAFGEVEREERYPDLGVADPRVTEYDYDTRGRAVETRMRDEGGALADLRTTVGYDALGQTLWTTDARGNALIARGGLDPVAAAAANLHTTTTAYDGLGRKVRETMADPDGPGDLASPVMTYRHDLAGNVVETTDPLGYVSAQQRDALGRVVVAGGGGRAADFDVAGGTVTATLAGHGVADGDLVWVRGSGDPELDGLRRASVADADHFAFDAPGASDGAAGGLVLLSPTHTYYNSEGTVKAVIDGRDAQTSFSYNALDRKVAEVAGDLGASATPLTSPRTTFKYDIAGAVVETTRPNGFAAGSAADYTARSAYDLLGRKVEESAGAADTRPVPGAAPVKKRPTTYYEYDAAGNVVATVDPRGVWSESDFDWAGRPVAARAGVTEIVSVSVDADGYGVAETAGHGLPVGSRIRLLLGRIDGGNPAVVTALATSVTGLRFAATDGTSMAGLLAGLGTGDGSELHFAASASRTDYNALGEVVAATDALGATAAVEYDGFGRKARDVTPDPDGPGPLPAAVTTYGYDEAGNVVWTTDPRGNDRIANGTLVAGSPLTAQRARDEHVSTSTFEYDALNRKTADTSPDPDPDDTADVAPRGEYEYDAAGRLTRSRQRQSAAGWTGSASVYDSLGRTVGAGQDWAAATVMDGGAAGHVRFDLAGGKTYDVFKVGERVLVQVDGRPDLGGVYPVVAVTGGYSAASFTVDAGSRAGNLSAAGGVVVARYAASTAYDAAGRAVAATDPLGRTSLTDYDPLGRVVREQLPAVDADGNAATPEVVRPTTTYEYDADGNVVESVGALGNVHPEGSSERDAHASRSGYDALGRAVWQEMPVAPNGLRPRTATGYDVAGNVAWQQDARGFTSSYGYDPLNRAVAETMPDGDGTGAGRVVRHAFDPNGNAVFSTTPLGEELGEDAGRPVPRRYTSFTKYDALNRSVMTAAPDPDGPAGPLLPSVTRIGYDVSGNVAWTLDALGNAAHANVPTAAQVQAMVDGHLHATRSEYDDLNRAIAVYDADADNDAATSDDVPVTRFEYDAAGNTTSRTDGEDNETRYQYDPLNRQVFEEVNISETEDANRAWVYDAAGNLAHYRNRNEQLFYYKYDDLGRKTGERWAEDDDRGLPEREVTYRYDVAGRMTGDEETFGTGGDLRVASADDYGYDRLGRLVVHEQVRADGPTVRQDYGHNSNNQINEEVTAVDGTEQVRNLTAYDATGRVASIRQTTPAPPTTTATGGGPGGPTDQTTAQHCEAQPVEEGGVAHDDCGAAVSVFSVRQVNFAYDADDNRTELTRWAGASAATAFPSGDAARTPDLPGPAAVATTYRTDEAGRPAGMTHDGRDAAGGEVPVADYRGFDVAGSAIARDALGRVTGLFVEAAAPLAGDSAGSPTQEGQHAFTYDANGQLVDADRPSGYGPDEYYDFDTEGNRDGAGDPEALADNRLAGHDYDAEGNLLSGPDASTYVYDQGNRLVAVRGEGDDDAGPVVVGPALDEMTSSIFGQTTYFGADANGVGADYPAGRYELAYVGGAVSFGQGFGYSLQSWYVASGGVESPGPHGDYGNGPGVGYPTPQEMEQNDAGRSVLIDHPGGPIGVRLDDSPYSDNSDGGVGAPRFTLASVTGGETDAIHYTYDAAGNRIARRVPEADAAEGGAAAEAHVNDAAGNLLLVVDGDTGAVVDTYLHGPRPLEVLLEGRPGVAALAAQASADAAASGTGGEPEVVGEQTAAWLLADPTGSVRDAADAAGVSRRHLRYGAFGGVLDAGGAATDADPLPRHGFTGQQRERELGEAGLIYMNARYYDPALGRFVSQDPIGFGGGVDNLYGYVGNDAVNATDPSGEFIFTAALIASVVATALAGGTAVAAHNSDSFAGFLADAGGDTADFFGVDSFTVPLGFASFSFGRADDGSQYFGIGGFIDVTGGAGGGFGLNTLVTEDARGRRGSRVGATVGYSQAGFNLRAGVSPAGDFTGGATYGAGPVSAGPSGTYGKGGFSSGLGGNVNIAAPFTENIGWRPTLNLGGGVGSDGFYGDAGIGLQIKNPETGHFVGVAEAGATFTNGRGLSGYTLGYSPLALAADTAAQRRKAAQDRAQAADQASAASGGVVYLSIAHDDPELEAQTQYLLWLLENHIKPGFAFKHSNHDTFYGNQQDDDGARLSTWKIRDGDLIETAYSSANRQWNLQFHEEQGGTHGLIERVKRDGFGQLLGTEIVRPSDKQLQEMADPNWAAYLAQSGESDANKARFRTFAHAFGALSEAGLRMVPVGGWTLDVEEAFTGNNAVSGQQLSTGERGMAKASAGLGTIMGVSALVKALDTAHGIMKVRSVANALDGSSGLTIRLRNMPAELITDPSTGRGVGVFGQAMRSSSTTAGHGEAMIRYLLTQDSDKYEYVAFQRSLRTLADAGSGKSLFAKGEGRAIPDVIGVRRDGKIDLFEITSQTQNNDQQLEKLKAMRATLPQDRRGQIRAWRPGE